MPFPTNEPGPDDLLAMTPEAIAELAPEILARLQQAVEDRLTRAKATRARFEDALTLRYAERAAALRREQGRDTGTVRFEDDGVTVVAEAAKRVDWSQAQLAAMVTRIRDAGDDPAEFIDITYRVSERKYAAWPEAIRRGFQSARIVRTAAPSFTLSAPEASA